MSNMIKDLGGNCKHTKIIRDFDKKDNSRPHLDITECKPKKVLERTDTIKSQNKIKISG